MMRKAGPVKRNGWRCWIGCEAEAGPGPVPVEKLLRAFLEPPLLRIKEIPNLPD